MENEAEGGERGRGGDASQQRRQSLREIQPPGRKKKRGKIDATNNVCLSRHTAIGLTQPNGTGARQGSAVNELLASPLVA